MNSSRLFDVNPLPPIGTGRPVGPIGNPQSVFYTPTMAGAPTQATLPGSAPPILNNPRMPHGYHGQSEVNSEWMFFQQHLQNQQVQQQRMMESHQIQQQKMMDLMNQQYQMQNEKRERELQMYQEQQKQLLKQLEVQHQLQIEKREQEMEIQKQVIESLKMEKINLGKKTKCPKWDQKEKLNFFIDRLKLWDKSESHIVRGAYIVN